MNMSIQSILLNLTIFLLVCTMVESVLPDGSMTAYVRYCIGLLVVLFVLTLGKGITLPDLWRDTPFEMTFDLKSTEQIANERVQSMLKERITTDVLNEFPGCTSVDNITLEEDGSVSGMELAVDEFVSRSAIAKRYGVSPDRIIIRGVGET